MPTTAPATLPQKETYVPAKTWTPVTDANFDGKSTLISNIGNMSVNIVKQTSAIPDTIGIPLPGYIPNISQNVSALPLFTQATGYVAYAYSESGTTVSAEVFA